MDQPDSYLRAHRYDQATIQYDRPDRAGEWAMQPRDVAIVRDVWRYRFLTAPQLLELWWPGRGPRAGQRRLAKLFHAGHLERFRPVAPKGEGSYPWTYHLAAEGHRLLQRAGVIDTNQRFSRKAIYDYRYVLHELHLNAWVLAWRRRLGRGLLSWEGETYLEPPSQARKQQLCLDDDWSAHDLRDARPRQLKPDAVLEIARDDNREESRLFLIEFDRTRRVDKNYGKFRRYDAYLNSWWHHTRLADRAERPFVLFVCQDEEQRQGFVRAADLELTGHRWHPALPPERQEYEGRRRLLFCVEQATHAGVLEAWRLPAVPARHAARNPQINRVRLPGVSSPVDSAPTKRAAMAPRPLSEPSAPRRVEGPMLFEAQVSPRRLPGAAPSRNG